MTVWRHRGPFADIWGPLMTSGVLCCYHGTLMAALEALSVAVANGAFVPWHPPQSQSTGTNIYFGLTPKVKAGPLDPLGPQFAVDSLSDFRASRDGSGPSGQIRPGSAGQTRAQQNEPGPCGTDQSLVGPTRTPRGQTGPRRTSQGTGTDRVPRDEPGPRRKNQRTGTDQDPAG